MSISSEKSRMPFVNGLISHFSQQQVQITSTNVDRAYSALLFMVDINRYDGAEFRAMHLSLVESVKLVGFKTVKERIDSVLENGVIYDEFGVKVKPFDLNIYDKCEKKYNKFIRDLNETAEGVRLRPCKECGNVYHTIEYFQAGAADESQNIRATCTNTSCGKVSMLNAR